ncbi:MULTISPECIES: hypothetical protein [Brasilonema]|nr:MULTISPECIES: hypothetical protein [Brasilonema]
MMDDESKILNAKHSQHRPLEGDFSKGSLAAKLKTSPRLGILLLAAVIVLLPLVVELLTSFVPNKALSCVLGENSWFLVHYHDTWETG